MRADRGVSQLEELREGIFGFNDMCSLSGYFAAKQELADRGLADGFFAREVCTGSHAASIRAILSGAIDVAAIDSNVLSLAEGEMPELSERVRVIESWGPHPIQPMVLSASLHEELGPRLGEALLAMMDDPEAGPALRRFGLERCVSIEDALYADERRALEELGQLRPCVR